MEETIAVALGIVNLEQALVELIRWVEYSFFFKAGVDGGGISFVHRCIFEEFHGMQSLLPDIIELVDAEVVEDFEWDTIDFVEVHK